MREDLESAASGGKRLAIMWELRGCPYCRETHLVNFADTTITNYIRDNFEVLQLNLIGSRKVTDFDPGAVGKRSRPEIRDQVHPHVPVFPPLAGGIEAKEPMAREVARAPGYSSRSTFSRCSASCGQPAYERGSFKDFLAANG